MGILSVDLNKINLDDVNFDEDGPETINDVRLMDWRNRFKQRKSSKKDISKELMHVPWYPTKTWHYFMQEDEKKGIELISTDKN